MVLNRDNRLFIQFYLPFFPTDVRASGSAENHYFGALHSARKQLSTKANFPNAQYLDTTA